MHKSLITVAALLSLLLIPGQLWAQAGVSSGAVGAARSGYHLTGPLGQYLMPSPDFFRVEEFVNYHRHDLPLPKKGKRVHLDIQNLELKHGKSVFQFGITTPRALKSKNIPPLNLVLVVDESGSMNGDKIENLKDSLRAFVERFRANDRITIVGFESTARVILEAAEKTNVNKISKAIDDIHAGGTTNLHAGLMCGYEMALKQFDPERTNRMIFLTDGNANVGVTEAEDIARESKRCIQQGISLVTIGLGVDMNNGLLREIADSGRGVMHFIGDAKDIKKTFIEEIDSVLAPAARKVRLNIEFESNGKTPKVFGYEHVCQMNRTDKGYSFNFKLDDLNHGATQVVLVRVPSHNTKPLKAKATLTYTDAINKKKVSLTSSLKDLAETELRQDTVKRNYAIALVANSLKSAARASHDNDSTAASKKLRSGIRRALNTVEDKEDKNVVRVVKIAREYLSHLNPEQEIASVGKNRVKNKRK